MALQDLDLDLGVSEDDQPLDQKSCDDDAGSVSDSPSLTCAACKVSSKHACPIAARKSELDQAGGKAPGKMQGETSVRWGKFTARKKKTASGRRVKVKRKCGAWCRICANIFKKFSKIKKYRKIAKAGAKKGDKQAAAKKIKEELDDGTLSERWMRAHAEAVHQHAGGKRRVNSKGASVQEVQEEKHELSQPGKFYTLAKYKEVFGDPVITKAKIVKRKWQKKTVRGIVVVSATDAGILEHKTTSSGSVRKDRVKFNATEALVDEDLDEAESDAISEMSQEFTHPGPSGAHPFSLEGAVGAYA